MATAMHETQLSFEGRVSRSSFIASGKTPHRRSSNDFVLHFSRHSTAGPLLFLDGALNSTPVDHFATTPFALRCAAIRVHTNDT
jgi:hypothetical protein